MRVGFVGLGTIAAGVLRIVHEPAFADDFEFVGAVVRDVSKPRPAGTPRVCAAVDELVAFGKPDVVVEAGGHAALACHGPAVLRHGIDLVMLSVGALAECAVESDIVAAARTGGGHAIVASGAIGGLDALSAAAVGGLDRVTHTVRKPAGALLPLGEAATLVEPRELFRGPAREGALRFPENVNVVAAVSLAGCGFDRTELCVVADPSLRRNTHVVEASGRFGNLRFEIANVPTEENPRTGRLVAMSVVHTLRQLRAPIRIG